jgi:hypothetical protein
MMKLASLLTLLVTALVFLLPAAPAQAQRDRVFVASYGSDSNPCTFGSPCKTFQQAVNVVAQGGEVTAIDSAGFGTITISHAVTITSPNGVEAGIAAPASGAAAITINAGSSDAVSLSGLTLDGDNVASTTGIQFNSGGSLNIRNSVIRNFGGFGIFFQPNAPGTLSVSNTLVADNGSAGIVILPSGPGNVAGVLDHVEMENNLYGLFVQNQTSQPINVTVSDSVSASNQSGIVSNAPGEPATIMVRNSTIANNTGYGLLAQDSGATVWVTRSTITGNGNGWGAAGGTVTSYGDNNIVGNTGSNNAPPSIGYE